MEIMVFFDLDNTLVSGQTQRIMASYLWRQGWISSFFLFKIYLWFLLYKLGVVSDVTQVMEKAYQLVKGMKVSTLERVLYGLVLEEIEPKIFSQALEEIQKHRDQGHRVGLVSNSIDPLVKILKQRLNLSFNIATKLESKNGVFTGKLKGPIIYGEEKLRAVRAFLAEKGESLEGSYAFADHYSDLPLLKAVAHPVVVNPDNKLIKKAQCYHWPISRWSQTSSG